MVNHPFCRLALILISVQLFGQINSNSPKVPFNSNTKYQYGIMPTNLPTSGTYGKSQDAANAYEAWKTSFLETCSGKGRRVKFDQSQFTVSEGIAYGMLLAAYAGDKPLLDDLWLYYKSFLNSNGVMNWKINGCTAKDQSNGATDAELDAAWALIVAATQWPTATSPYTYGNEAKSLINKIALYEIESTSYQTLNGDAWGASTCRNPSYFAPGYYREFATFVPTNATFWNNTANASDNYLLKNRNGTTGLVSNWADNNATPNTCNGPLQYGQDACRNPWRMAVDVLWHGSAIAKSGTDICTKLAAWTNGKHLAMAAPIAVDATNANTGQYHNSYYVSTWSVGVMGSSTTYQTHLNNCYTETKNITTQYDGYYGPTLRAIMLFTLTGNFWKPSAVVGVLDPEISDLAIYPNPFNNNFRLENIDRVESVEILDVYGKTIESFTTKASHLELGDSYPKGMYFVKLRYADKHSQFKIVKE